MATNKRKKEYTVRGTNIVTFAGESLWCKYLEANMQRDEYNPKGKYSVKLLADPDAEDFKLFSKKIDAIIDNVYDDIMNDKGEKKVSDKDKKNLKRLSPIKDHIIYQKDEDGVVINEEDTGKKYIEPAIKNVDDKKENIRQQDYVKLIGVGNKEIPRSQCPEIGNGSIIKCKIYANPYFMPSQKQAGVEIPPRYGVSLIWSAVKIIDLVEYGSGGEDFDEDEGYTPPTTTEASDIDEEVDF